MANVTITHKKSIVDQLDETRRRIEQRAYELFRLRDDRSSDPVGDWLEAEREILSKPAVELREKDGTFTVVAALPGVEPKDVSLDVTTQEAQTNRATIKAA